VLLPQVACDGCRSRLLQLQQWNAIIMIPTWSHLMSTDVRKAMTIRIDRHLKELAERAAAESYRSLNGFVEAVLAERCSGVQREETQP
jgi:hypothetical protein